MLYNIQIKSIKLAPYLIVPTILSLLLLGPIVIFPLLFVFLLYTIAIISVGLLFLGNVKHSENTERIFFYNSDIKKAHKIAYVINFIFAGLFLITIFTWGFSILIIGINYLTIGITGTIGLTGIIGYERDHKSKRKELLIEIIKQYIFFIDAKAAVIIYRKYRYMKRRNRFEETTE